MDSHTVFCRGTAQYHRHSLSCIYVYADGSERCRRCPVLWLALSAVGVEAFVESVYRHPQDQALVDTYHADAHRRCLGWHCLHAANSVLVSRHHVLLLLDGFCQCHARHSSRRLLYADARRAQPNQICRTAKHVLPSCRCVRQCRTCQSGRQA